MTSSLRSGLKRLSAIAFILLGTGCQVSGTPTPEANSSSSLSSESLGPSGIRQTDADGHPLPFTTTFPNRWNKNNDGTTFEPCTALSHQELSDMRLDPSSVVDPTLADGQTARGCRWKLTDRELASMSLTVGDSPKFELRREFNKEDGTARPSATIDGREVLVQSSDKYSCTTEVKVQESVALAIAAMTADPPPIGEICDYALEFTRLAISKMPP